MRRKKIFRPSSLRPPTIDHRSLSSVGGPTTFPPSHLSTFHLPTESKIKNPKSKILTPLTPPRTLRVRAFSLVELLAVVGIIALISVAAVPVMRGLGGSQSSRATAQILVSALEQARTAAILTGTNVFLAIPNASFPVTNLRYSSYVLLRPRVTNNGGPNDDFLTNQSAPWLVLSKWERLPGDLGFSPRKTDSLPSIQVSNVTVAGTNFSGTLPAIGFNSGGGLVDQSGTNGLLFASTNPANFETTNAKVADQVFVAQFSGRIRYAGLTNNAPFK